MIDKEFPTENDFFNLTGFLRTLTEEPTYIPKDISQQMVLVVTGGSTAAYFYDRSNQAWKYVTLT